MFLEEFTQKKKSLLSEYTNLLESSFAKYGHIKRENISDALNALTDERFVISICGAMNAGKSTLLNLLLFNDRKVLPVAATVASANIVQINFGVQETAKITFYNKKEFENIKIKVKKLFDNCNHKGEDWHRHEIEQLLNKYRDLNELENEYIKLENHNLTITNLEEIPTYGKAGESLEIFVKKIEIETPNPLLRNATFVDTPGLFDPNPLRSEKTFQWINASNAVLYLTLAHRPLSKEDKSFIYEHLGSVPQGQVFLVLTQADAIKRSDENTSIEYVKSEIRKNNDPMEELFHNSPVYFTSSIAARIQRKLIKGQSLTSYEQDRFDWAKKYDQVALYENEGNTISLFNDIETLVMNQKGSRILTEAGSKIRGFCNQAIQESRNQLETRRKYLIDRELTVNELKNKISAVRRNISAMEDIEKQAVTDLDHQIEISKRKIFDSLRIAIKKANEDFDQWIKHENVDKSISESRFKMKQLLKDVLNDGVRDNVEFEHVIDDIHDITHRMNAEFESLVNETIGLDRKYRRPFFYPDDDLHKVIDETSENLRREKLSKERERVFGILWTDTEVVKANLMHQAQSTLEATEKTIRSNIGLLYDNLKDKHIINTVKYHQDYMNKYKISLESLENSGENKETDFLEIKRQIMELEEMVVEMQRDYSSIRVRLEEMDL